MLKLRLIIFSFILAGALTVQVSAMEVQKDTSSAFPKTKIGGYVQIQYEAYPNAVNTSTDTFNIKRARVEIKSELSENFLAHFSFEATKFSTATSLKTAYIEWKGFNYPNVRFGQFKIPFTRESLISDSQTDFVERSLVVDNLVTKLPDSYDTGVQFSGKQPSLDYALAVTNGTAENTLADGAGKAYISRVVLNPLNKLFIGGSGYYTERGKAFTIRRKAAAELRYDIPKGFLQVEYVKAAEQSVEKDGWYIYAFFTPVKSLQTGARYEKYDPDNSKQNDDSDSSAVGINYFFGPSVKLMLNGISTNPKNKPVSNSVILRMQFLY